MKRLENGYYHYEERGTKPSGKHDCGEYALPSKTYEKMFAQRHAKNQEIVANLISSTTENTDTKETHNT